VLPVTNEKLHRLAKSEAKIILKNEVIAELLEEYTKVKKVFDLRRFGMD
jgi:hypothetical protein